MSTPNVSLYAPSMAHIRPSSEPVSYLPNKYRLRYTELNTAQFEPNTSYALMPLLMREFFIAELVSKAAL